MRVYTENPERVSPERFAEMFGVDLDTMKKWISRGRWNYWRDLNTVASKWKERLRDNLEVMSELAQNLIGGIDLESIKKAPIGQRILALKLITDSMEKSAKMLGENSESAPPANSLLVNMDPARSSELLGRLGLRPVVAIPAPLDVIKIDPGSSSIDKARVEQGAGDAENQD